MDHQPRRSPFLNLASTPPSPRILQKIPSLSPNCHAESAQGLTSMSEKLESRAFVPDSARLPNQPSSAREQRGLFPTGDYQPPASPTSQNIRQGVPSSRPPYNRAPTLSHYPSHTRRLPHQQPYVRPRGLRITNLIRPWIPLLLYGATSLGFLVAIALWRTEVFERLDELSNWLQTDENGHAILFFLIFLTTFPPIPLYSTLTILSGYTFGPWTGAIISYFAALTGALTVFTISRTLLRDCISRWLNSTTTIKRVVRAIEKRPKLLFLIRLAPYPYNVMNSLLAASPTLTFKTYTICTALSLFKVIIHTSLGASIHSFKDYHSDEGSSGSTVGEEDSSAHTVARSWTIFGVLLCVAIFVYLSIVARRAVDEELDDIAEDSEERTAFLSAPSDIEALGGESMAESPFRTDPLFPPRPGVVELEDRFINSNEGWQ